MVFREVLGDLTRYDIRLLGTDIDDGAVGQASYGVYSRLEIERGMPQDVLARALSPSRATNGKSATSLRALATFQTQNLLKPFGFPAKFDLIFCRNVAIYFAEPDRKRLFTSLGNRAGARRQPDHRRDGIASPACARNSWPNVICARSSTSSNKRWHRYRSSINRTDPACHGQGDGIVLHRQRFFGQQAV